MDKTKVKDSLEVAIAALLSIKNALDDEPTVAKQDASLELSNFEQLKQALKSDNWPEAVNKHLICEPDNEEDKTERGRGIIELMIEERMPGLRFLDFGCGEGQTVHYAAAEKAEVAIGYDTKSYDWIGKYGQLAPNLKFTTDFEEVQKNGPYDVILLFDVIDHAIGESPIEILKKAASVLKPSGKIYMRTHPQISRHATHLYHHMNKAYLHLVFSPEELNTLLPDQKYAVTNNGPFFPLASYSKMINETGLKEIARREIKEPVELFFKTPMIAKRIMDNTKMKDFPEFQMSLAFIDYILGKE